MRVVARGVRLRCYGPEGSPFGTLEDAHVFIIIICCILFDSGLRALLFSCLGSYTVSRPKLPPQSDVPRIARAI